MSREGDPKGRGRRQSERAPFSELLNHLFATKLKTLPDGRMKPYTLRDVANVTGISIGFLSECRNGYCENPAMEHVDLLARFFGVSPSYFFGPLPGDSVELEATIHAALTQPSMKKILLRAGAFGEVEREAVLDMMDALDRVTGKAALSRAASTARSLD